MIHAWLIEFVHHLCHLLHVYLHRRKTENQSQCDNYYIFRSLHLLFVVTVTSFCGNVNLGATHHTRGNDKQKHTSPLNAYRFKCEKCWFILKEGQKHEWNKKPYLLIHLWTSDASEFPNLCPELRITVHWPLIQVIITSFKIRKEMIESTIRQKAWII